MSKESGEKMMEQANAAIKAGLFLNETRSAIVKAGRDREQIEVLRRGAEGMEAMYPGQTLYAKAVQECEAALARKDGPDNSAEVMECVNQLLKELPPPAQRILSLWCDGCSQDQIVSTLRREKVSPRSKQFVNRTLKEVRQKFEAKEIPFERPGPSTPNFAYVGTELVQVDLNTPRTLLEKSELETTIKAWRSATQEQREEIEQQYGPELRQELISRGHIPQEKPKHKPV